MMKHKPGVLQLRKFTSAQPQLHQPYEQGITDLYVHQQGHPDVGIKFREPGEKDYGWKLKRFECKLAVQEQTGGLAMERWEKYEVEMGEPVKFRLRDRKDRRQREEKRGEQAGGQGGQEEQEQKSEEQEQQGQGCESTDRLPKQTLKLHAAIVDSLLQSPLRHKPQIIAWCGSPCPSLHLFLVHKLKEKAGGTEVGHLRVQGLSTQRVWYYETRAWECGDPGKMELLIQKWGQGNLSYPGLLEGLAAGREPAEDKADE